jgi:hypothetical protein
VIPNHPFKTLLLTFLTCVLFTSARSQSLQESFYYNPGGFTFIPALKKPSIIYQGKLFAGTRQLSALFSHLNNEELNRYFRKYKSNKTASTVLTLAGVGLSVYSLVDWRSGERKFNWYTFGGGLALNGLSGYLDAKASEHLRNAAVVFDNATKKTTFVPRQSTLTFTIALSR